MILDRSIAPAYQIPDRITLQEPTKLILPNGIPLFYMHTPHIDAVKVEVITSPHMQWLNEGKALVPFFTLHMLLEGTSSLKSEELDHFFDHYASEIDIISTFEQNGLSLLCTRKHLSAVLPLFRSLFTEAVFPEKELKKRKSQKELTISLQREQNGARANQLFRRSLFGEDHPYGFIADEADVRAIHRDDLQYFYENFFLLSPEIFVTGNLDEVHLDEINNLFSDLSFIPDNEELPVVDNAPYRRISEQNVKSLQSSIRMGQTLIPKSHPDYHALTVFNTILGGYFGSRLIKNIREEKGHTYGIYSSIGSLKPADYWYLMADVQEGYAEEVISEVYREIELLKTVPITPSEQETVRNYMIGHLLSSFSSSFDLMGRFKTIHQHGLDYRFYEDQLSFTKTFTPEDILRVGQAHIHPDRILEVVVGAA